MSASCTPGGCARHTDRCFAPWWWLSSIAKDFPLPANQQGSPCDSFSRASGSAMQIVRRRSMIRSSFMTSPYLISIRANPLHLAEECELLPCRAMAPRAPWFALMVVLAPTFGCQGSDLEKSSQALTALRFTPTADTRVDEGN